MIDERVESVRSNSISKTRDKDKLNRISSAKGSFRDLPFNDAHPKEKAPIYHNSSIPTSPLRSYGNAESISCTNNSDYDDAPLTNTTELLQGKPWINLSTVNKEYYQSPSTTNKSRNFYDTPSKNDSVTTTNGLERNRSVS